MAGRINYHGGLLPMARHGARVILNRIWSRVLKHGLLRTGSGFNVDFTARILGGKAVAIGSRFHATRGLKIVVCHPSPKHPHLTIGDDVCMNEHVTINAFDPITIGNGVLLGSRVYIGNANHGDYREAGAGGPQTPPNLRSMSGSGALTIGDNVWIGEGAILPSGVTIGAGSIVGAGAVVTRTVPPAVIVAGNPARIVREFDPRTQQWIRRSDSVAAL